MAFTLEPSRTPVSIADISIDLFDPEPGDGSTAGATYSVQIRMSDGSVVVRTGNLVPHITTAQRNALMNFMATLRTQAVGEFLP